METNWLTVSSSPSIKSLKPSYSIGYLPKGKLPTKGLLEELRIIGKENRCIFIQLEPNIRQDELPSSKLQLLHSELKPAAHPLFTKHTFVLDLTKTEDELLANMHSKNRYNIKVAKKHGVEVVEENTANGIQSLLASD